MESMQSDIPRKTIKWTPERLSEAQKVVQGGNTIRAAAQILGKRWGFPVSSVTLKQTLYDRGLNCGRAYNGCIEWTPEKLGEFSELYKRGYCYSFIAHTLSEKWGIPVSAGLLHKTRANHCDARGNHAEEVQTFADYPIPDGDYLITCDYHAPSYSVPWVERSIAIAKKFDIHRQIIVGDLFDMDFAKHWYSDKPGDLDSEIEKVRPLIDSLLWFDKIFLLRGNHENRVGRMTDSKIQAKHLLNLFGPEAWAKKCVYIEADRAFIGDEWLAVHPKSYSQVSATVAIRLAEKFHRHVFNAHGHFSALRYDRSGKYMGIDLGGMFDCQKIEYIQRCTTTHPVWDNGFGMIRNGYFHLFHGHSDFEFYMEH